VAWCLDYSGNASGARRARRRSSGESPGDGQTLRSSGRQINVRVKRTNNPPPGQSKRKATDTEEEDDQSEKKYRKCEKAGCSATYPVCFASASERCAKNGYTSRWYHLSCGEHFCNECFDHYYRSHKDGYETFASWKKVWTSNGKSEPSLKAFMADQQLPFWVQCTKPDCRKWRQLTKEIQLTASLAATYRCGMKFNNIKRVAEVTDSWWHSMLILPPLFKESPASPFLAAYYPDCVGMSPSGSASNASLTELRADHCRAVQPQIPGLCPYFQPFYQPNECGKALCVRPDMMELDELYEFPEFSRDPTMYLALRNLILASWHRNCKVPSRRQPTSVCHNRNNPNNGFCFSLKEVLTAQKCALHIIVRGLRNVIIIGAGASGLAAARQLQNFGSQVMVLEARDRIGGRVWDDTSLGVTVGRGAQIVNGCVNNPIALMCEQVGIKMHKLGDRCDLFQEGGQATDPAIDKRMDFHFNAILDVVSEWRKDKSQNQDIPLKEKVQEVKKNFLQESGIQFSELEEKVLQFHLSNLEYACGSTLDQVSARSWDHNEFFAQFSGDHTLLTKGYSLLLHKLGEGLDIRTKCPVCNLVLVTVPLTLLQKNTIQFNPPLPERKLKAIHSLGAGIIEKIALQFPYRFWDSKIQGADYFGHIPPGPDKRGMFSVFYDMEPQGKQAVLMSVITGDAVPVVRDMEDKEVVDECMKVLRELFKEQEVPEPLHFFVTHWSKDVWSQMSYSFVKTGGSGEAYDILAEDVQGKVFFAGEATNRHFPQTVTGAYLSGVREASKMAAM
ncbi:Lysine-specific histone demethylase 1B, partial [Nibea albiflora]